MRQPDHLRQHQFRPGTSGNLNGRGLGVRNRLNRRFVFALSRAWEQHGVEALQRVIAEEPVQFIKIVASLCPREVTLDASDDLRSALARLGKLAKARYAKDHPRVIDVDPDGSGASGLTQGALPQSEVVELPDPIEGSPRRSSSAG